MIKQLAFLLLLVPCFFSQICNTDADCPPGEVCVHLVPQLWQCEPAEVILEKAMLHAKDECQKDADCTTVGSRCVKDESQYLRKICAEPDKEGYGYAKFPY